MTPGRFWGLLEEISINQLQTDCYNFTLFFPSFHTFNEFGCLLNSKHLQSGQKKKKIERKTFFNTIGSSKTANVPSRLSSWNWPFNSEWPPFGRELTKIIIREQQTPQHFSKSSSRKAQNLHIWSFSLFVVSGSISGSLFLGQTSSKLNLAFLKDGCEENTKLTHLRALWDSAFHPEKSVRLSAESGESFRLRQAISQQKKLGLLGL